MFTSSWILGSGKAYFFIHCSDYSTVRERAIKIARVHSTGIVKEERSKCDFTVKFDLGDVGDLGEVAGRIGDGLKDPIIRHGRHDLMDTTKVGSYRGRRRRTPA